MLVFACMIPLLMPILRASSYVLWLSYMVFCSCCTTIIHSNHFYSIDGDYDNGWNLEDVEVITLINRWIPTLIPPQLSDHMGFQIIYRSDHLSRYIHALLVFWTDIQAMGLYSRLWYLYSLSILLWLGHSLSELKRFPWSFDCEGMCCVYLGGGLTI